MLSVTPAAEAATAAGHPAPAGHAAPADHPASAEIATAHALLRCCVRELAGPRGQVWPAEPYLLLRLAGTLLRVRGGPVGCSLRFSGAPDELRDGVWRPVGSERLAELAEAELTAVTGVPNGEFAGQVAAGRAAIEAILAARAGAAPPPDRWLESEQSLVYGHAFHPTPKARGGAPGAWLEYAPEAHASFPLRFLGVRDCVIGGDTGVIDSLAPPCPPGHTPLPVHPWQASLLAAELAGPLSDGRLIDLGHGSPVVPTSSVRTVYDPAAGVCLKFSLDVRITNCVRKNAWYELAGAVELTDRLGPVFDALAADFPGARWLREPGYRAPDLGTRLLEGLGVIVREGPWGVVSPGVTPVLAGALTSGHGRAAAVIGSAPDPLEWWAAYVSLVAPPVLHAYLAHGVVLEPHLQNVLVGLDSGGHPVEAVFRDLEGTKLVGHDLSGLPEGVARSLTYNAERGWSRVVYCLVVNHLGEVAAEVSRHVRDQGRVWAVVRECLASYADEFGCPLPLADLLAGAPLPAKANLGVRWARDADRAAGYVPVGNPLAASSPLPAGTA
ncbi:iron transporter [Bailinhaonella thermotolerans]|uniref:Iron transporter n=1 Tax=Bailinhaonella thermotolerans TaxID=1070861 RepID=A0A3A4B6K2_9ACTN|nr:iron transporter [Bailinhaonella thermotolerans]